MAYKRIAMRKLKELLRLKFESKLSQNAISRALKLSGSTVHDYLLRFKASGLSWPLPDDIDDLALERRLFPGTFTAKKHEDVPDWGAIHLELKKDGVTRALLWEEYKRDHPHGYEYSQFCEVYSRYAAKLNLSMRQSHKAGEKLFVDYSGQTMPITDPQTGEVRSAQIFVAVLGASSYTFAEATYTQQIPDWVGSHIRAFEFLGGVPELVVPDNLKSGVTKACRYDPSINPSYLDMARHYGTAIMPARARKPKDKAKAEGGVLLVQRWILACLRNRVFFSLEELNDAIRELLIRLNQKPFKKLSGSRESTFLALDKPVLKPLPESRHTVAEWFKAKVPPDYHVEVLRHHYSVPYTLVKEQVEIRVTERIVEILHRGKRVASHARSQEVDGRTTLREHMPLPHQRQDDWTPEKIMSWAEKTGYETACLFQAILEDRDHAHVGLRVCLGIIRLEKDYPLARIEAACLRANLLGSTKLDSIRSILDLGLDAIPVAPRPEPAPIQHENIRGADYYARKALWALPL